MSNRYEIPSNGFGLNSRDLREKARFIELWISELTPDERRILSLFFEGLSQEAIPDRSGFPESYVRRLTLQIKRKAKSFGIKLIQEST